MSHLCLFLFFFFFKQQSRRRCKPTRVKGPKCSATGAPDTSMERNSAGWEKLPLKRINQNPWYTHTPTHPYPHTPHTHTHNVFYQAWVIPSCQFFSCIRGWLWSSMTSSAALWPEFCTVGWSTGKVITQTSIWVDFFPIQPSPKVDNSSRAPN